MVDRGLIFCAVVSGLCTALAQSERVRPERVQSERVQSQRVQSQRVQSDSGRLAPDVDIDSQLAIEGVSEKLEVQAELAKPEPEVKEWQVRRQVLDRALSEASNN